MAGKIFISYRREDTAADALGIGQYLEREFGRRNVFLDIDMRAGSTFPEELERRLADCKVLLALIGSGWLGARADDGQRRLDDPKDWVRLEISRALAREITVIPVKVGGAELPRKAELPIDIRDLLDRQAASVATATFRNDMAGLVRDIRAIPGGRQWMKITAAAVLLGGLVLGGLVYQGRVPMPTRENAEAAKSTELDKELARKRKAMLEQHNKDAERQVQAMREREKQEAKLRAEEYRKRQEIEKQIAQGKAFRDCPNCPEMVVVPAGRFAMGSSNAEEGHDTVETPVREVYMAKSFAVGKFEVSFAEWDICLAEGGCTHRPNDAGWGRGDLPVIRVSWTDAKAYVAWLTKRTAKHYRLLTEAEWEYVARAGTTTPFWWGTSISPKQANYDSAHVYGGSEKTTPRQRTVPVSSFSANHFGLHNILGNVYEWVEDCWHPTYAGAPTDGSVRSTDNCTHRIIRGGAWSVAPYALRAASRAYYPPADRARDIGFRVARTLE